MKKIKFLAAMFAGILLMGCGEAEVKSVEYYSKAENKAEMQQVLDDCRSNTLSGQICTNARDGMNLALHNQLFSVESK